MGAALFRLGAYEQAAEAYRRAIDMKDAEAAARRGLGNALVALDRPALAIDQFTASLARAKDARTYNGLGVAYDMQDAHPHAQAMYRAGLALKPGDLALENNLGLSLAASGDYRDAIAVLAKAAAAPGAGPRERNNLALAYGLSGDMANAARIARRDMDAAAVQKNLAMYAALRARNGGSLPVSGKTPAPDAPAPAPAPTAQPAAPPAAPRPMSDAPQAKPMVAPHRVAADMPVVHPSEGTVAPHRVAADMPVMHPAEGTVAPHRVTTDTPVMHAADPAQLAAMYDYPAVEPTPENVKPAEAPPAEAQALAAPEPTDIALADAPAPRIDVPTAAPVEPPAASAADTAVDTADDSTTDAARAAAMAAMDAPPARPRIAPLGIGVAFRPGALPQPATLAALPLHGTYYRARLAAYPSRMDATQGWLDMVKRAPELYGAVQIVAERSALTATRLRYALVTPPVAQRAPVEKMCAALEERGILCRVEAAGAEPALTPRG